MKKFLNNVPPFQTRRGKTPDKKCKIIEGNRRRYTMKKYVMPVLLLGVFETVAVAL